MTAEEKPRALARLVILDGTVWNAGDVPPPEVAARIRNPQCWSVETAPEPEPAKDPAADVAGSGRPVVPAAPGIDGIPNLTERPGDTPSSSVIPAEPGTVNGAPLPPVATLPEPPRSGRGASEAAWRTFAAQFPADIPPDADRGAIIAALQRAGVIK